MWEKILFENLKPLELEKIIKTTGIIYLPLGTLEWHQKHLPFGTDAFISYKLCKDACKITGGCVIPPLFFATDREHRIKGETLHGMDAKAGKILPGSIYYLKKNFFYKFLKQIIYNIEQQGFKKLVIVSAHSGTAQQQVLEKIAKEKEYKLQIIIFPGKKFVGGIDHAGKIETSLILAIKPELVQIERLIKPYFAMSGDDPHKANKTGGEKQIKAIVKQIIKRI